MHAVASLLARAVHVTPLGRAYARAASGDPGTEFSTRALAELDVSIAITGEDLHKIPSSAPLIIVANHPLGALDGLLLLALVSRVRDDMKIVGNSLLRSIDPLADRLLPVDVFGRTSTAVRRNGVALRSAIKWLERGGCLGMFPAGEVAHDEAPDGRILDAAWQHTAADLAIRTGARVVPVFIEGRNSRLFRAAGRIHPLLRTALLPRELWTKRHSQIEIRVGAAIDSGTLARLPGSHERTALLRSRVEALAVAPSPAEGRIPLARQLPIAQRGFATAIDANIDAIQHAVLMESGAFQVFCARAADLPAVLPEIGRLRELTFRHAGEGTGLSRDLDRFDETYRHLFVWDRTRKEIAGAYRVGATDEIATVARPLHSHALRLRRVAAEADRSGTRARPVLHPTRLPAGLQSAAVVVEGNFPPRRTRASLPSSLWRRQHQRSLCISSRQLLVKFLQTTRFDKDLGRLVKARNPPPPPRAGFVESTTVERIEDVSALVRRIEPDGKDIPVLLRQYLKLNAKLLGFTVDETFGNVLDGLVLVDLRDVAPAILSRYMGKEEAKRYVEIPGR